MSLVVQDADLEYDPEGLSRTARADFLRATPTSSSARASSGGQPHRVLYFWHMVGNKFLTLLSNMFTNLNLTDLETGYKAFRADLVQESSICARIGFRIRAGNHGKAGQGPLPHLRSGHLLQRANLWRRQKGRLEGRRSRHLRHLRYNLFP